MFLRFLVILTVCIFYTNSASAPSYMKACNKGDFNCMTEQAQIVFEHVLEGDKAYNIPPIKSLVIPSVEFAGTQISLKVNNLHFGGVENLKITSVEVDTDKKVGTVKISIPSLILTGDYKLNGKILVLALNGAGKGNITAVDGTGVWKFSYDLVEKGGEKYAKISKSSYQHVAKRLYLNFEDLFKGNPTLTTSTNELLNKEWEAVMDEFGGGLSLTVNDLFKLVADAFFSKIPANQLIICDVK